MMALNTGQILNNRYRIVRLLGQGGFGAVYKAWDINLGHACALKENLDRSSDGEQQFLREANILAGLNHPNLARVTDYFVSPGRGQYLVMDFVEGEDLQEKLDKAGGPLPEVDVVRWVGQVCDVLDHLHQQTPPVIHRDIKPANVRIAPDGRALVVDFGLAKVYKEGKLTSMGARAVTPGFAPPEQYLTSGATEPRSDIYALGATAYALLSGQVPPESIALTQSGQSLPALHTLNPRVSRPVEQAVAQAMQLQRDRRYASASEFKSALHRPVTPDKPAAPFTLTPAQSVPSTSRDASSFPVKWVIGAVFALFLFWLGAKALSSSTPAPFPAATEAPYLAVTEAPAATEAPYLAATEPILLPSVTPPSNIIKGDWVVKLRVNRAEDASGNQVGSQDGGWVLRINQDGSLINGSSIEGSYCPTVLTGSLSDGELVLNLSFNDQACCMGLETRIEARMDTANSFSGIHYPTSAIPQACNGLWADVTAYKK